MRYILAMAAVTLLAIGFAMGVAWTAHTQADSWGFEEWLQCRIDTARLFGRADGATLERCDREAEYRIRGETPPWER